MQKYEMMVVYKPVLFEDIKKSTIDKLQKFVEKAKGQMSEEENYGKRLLAYPINNFEEAHYVLYNLEIDSNEISKLKRQLGLDQNVLRYLITKQD